MRILIIMSFLLFQDSFKEKQLQHVRVKDAYVEKESLVKQYFESNSLDISSSDIFIRAFKKEMILEVWGKVKSQSRFSLIKTYDFCTTSGVPGPKRKEGDLQIPEGVYQINHFNPQSNFHLSLGINYPNASDKILSDKNKPGGNIYIHGNCVTIGCIPITDDKIKELYIMAVEAKQGGQQKIPVHIFPCKLTESEFKNLVQSNPNQKLKMFWENLKIVFDDFEKSRMLKPVKVNAHGLYYF